MDFIRTETLFVTEEQEAYERLGLDKEPDFEWHEFHFRLSHISAFNEYNGGLTTIYLGSENFIINIPYEKFKRDYIKNKVITQN
jgi:hypothetical protein